MNTCAAVASTVTKNRQKTNTVRKVTWVLWDLVALLRHLDCL